MLAGHVMHTYAIHKTFDIICYHNTPGVSFRYYLLRCHLRKKRLLWRAPTDTQGRLYFPCNNSYMHHLYLMKICSSSAGSVTDISYLSCGYLFLLFFKISLHHFWYVSNCSLQWSALSQCWWKELLNLGS
jgi:hypothetical protein